MMAAGFIARRAGGIKISGRLSASSVATPDRSSVAEQGGGRAFRRKMRSCVYRRGVKLIPSEPRNLHLPAIDIGPGENKFAVLHRQTHPIYR
jgi:hypothetical protein